MRIVALDPSTAKTGWALAVDGEVQQSGVFKAPSRLKTQDEKIDFMADTVRSALPFLKPDLVVIEECGRPPNGNVRVLRALVRVEAVCGREARAAGSKVLLVSVSAAREAVFGDGRIGKATVYHRIKESYPHFPWPPDDSRAGREGEKGGNDMSDAIVMALAGQKLADRR